MAVTALCVGFEALLPARATPDSLTNGPFVRRWWWRPAAPRVALELLTEMTRCDWGHVGMGNCHCSGLHIVCRVGSEAVNYQ